MSSRPRNSPRHGKPLENSETIMSKRHSLLRQTGGAVSHTCDDDRPGGGETLPDVVGVPGAAARDAGASI